MSKNKGYENGGLFISKFNNLNSIKGFSDLPSETQYILISSNIKNRNDFNEIILKNEKTDQLYFNKSLKSNFFISMLSKYSKVTIEIGYPSNAFESIYDLVTKIKKRKIKYLKIGIVHISFPSHITKKIISDDVSYRRFDRSIHSIPKNAFKDCRMFDIFATPSKIISIEESAFCNSSLVEVTIPSSVIKIGNAAFYICDRLKKVTFQNPSSVTSIGEKAFSFSKIEQIIIPSSVVSIGDNAFDSCLHLMKLTFEEPSSLTSLGKSVFNFCIMTEIKIPNSVTSTEDIGLSSCLMLKQVTIPSSFRNQVKKIEDKCKIIEI